MRVWPTLVKRLMSPEQTSPPADRLLIAKHGRSASDTRVKANTERDTVSPSVRTDDKVRKITFTVDVDVNGDTYVSNKPVGGSAPGSPVASCTGCCVHTGFGTGWLCTLVRTGIRSARSIRPLKSATKKTQRGLVSRRNDNNGKNGGFNRPGKPPEKDARSDPRCVERRQRRRRRRFAFEISGVIHTSSNVQNSKRNNGCRR